IEQRHLVNYVQGLFERLGLSGGESWASVSTLSADLGNTAVFGALCGGGTLHLVTQERAMDPSLWQQYLQEHPVDCLKIVPSHLGALLGSRTGEAAGALLPRGVLVLGGETSHWELVAQVLAATPGLRVFNHYGPTETTVGVLV